MPRPQIRTAVPEDVPALAALFRSSHPGDEPPPAFDALVGRGLVTVAADTDTLVGYVVAEAPLTAHTRITGIAVDPGHRRAGTGSLLLNHVLAGAPEDTVSAIAPLTAPAPIGLLLSHGFLGTQVLRPADGAALYLQRKVRIEYVDPDSRQLVPASAPEQLAEAVAPTEYAVTAVGTVSGEPVYEVARFERDDPATLQSGEAAAGLAFSGAVLAAITFMLGFSFASERYPDDVRLLLIFATVATTMSLIIYASAAGELARIRSNAFGRIMKWGNVLSEYGGVLPFLAALPITYAEVAGATWSAVVTGVVLSASLGWYEASEFSIARRFAWSLPTRAMAAVTSLAPAVSVSLAAAGVRSWPVTAVLVAALAGRTVVYLALRGPEAGIAEHRRVWQVRR